MGLVPGDHVCWASDDDDELLATVRAWAVEGIARGERVLYIADRTEAELRRRVDDLADLEELLDAGRVVLGTPSSMYGDDVVDERALLTYYAAATAEALAAGCSGLRVAAEVGALEDLDAVDAFVAWEQLADAFMNRAPMSALCIFDRRGVSDAAIAAVAAAHPTCHGSACDTSFVLHAHEDGFRLAGDVDTFDRFRLDTMLRNAAADAPSLVLHLEDLHHASGGCARVLDDLARRLGRRGGQLVLKSAPETFRTAWVALGFSPDDVVFA